MNNTNERALLSITSADVVRFWSKVDKSGECWIWTAGRYLPPNLPYGRFKINGRTFGAHVVAWYISNGLPPHDKMVLHTCDNASCVRHLYLGDQTANMLDRKLRGRTAKHLRHGRATLSWDDINYMRTHYTGIRGEIAALAKRFSVGKSQARRIIRMEQWS